MGEHHCAMAAWDECSEHRRVFGDLVPIERYSNGGDGRHHKPPCNCGDPNGREGECPQHWRSTTTIETEQ